MTSRPRRPSTVALRLRPVALAVAVLAVRPDVQALPAGAQTVAGQATVQSPAAGQLLIQQGSDKAIVDWKSFSIATGERVLINQPGSQSVLLNRVVGGEPSLILGQLQANGRVFLVNPRGIVFGRGSQVDAGSFVASTLDLRNDDFLAGRYSLAAGSTAPGSLRADGNISAPDGTVALVAPVLSVGGNVTAQRIGVAAAGSVRIDVEGDGLVLFNVRNEGLDARLDLLGRLQAEGGGSVEVRAQARAGFADTVLNMDGVVQARSLGSRGGRIVIDGGTAGGTRIAGTLDATGANAGEQGGRVTVLGAQLALTDTAVVDVSGRSGGGTALVGGGLHGAGTAHDAVDTRVAAGAVLRADALDAGNGGTVAVWSDRSTVFDGRISARGGAAGGDGGYAEVSGQRQLDFTGTVDLRPASAGSGNKGTLLLDPFDLVIGNTADIAGNGSNLDLGTPVVAAGDNPGATSRITATQVVAQLDGANVRLEATHDITVQTAIDASGNTGSGSLSLFAGNDIALLANVTTRGSDVVLGANHDFGGGNPASGVGTVSLASGVHVSTLGGGLTGGNIAVSGAAVTFGAGASLVAGADITVTSSASALALGALTAGGKVVVQADGGGLTQTGAVSVGADGSSFTATGSAQSIDLTNGANVFNGKTVALQSTGNAAITADSLVLAASGVGGRLTAIATSGGISQTGALTVGADGSSFATTGTVQSIDLTNGANVFNGKTVALQSTGNAAITADSLVLAASGVGGRLTAIATSGGISQTGALTVGADGSTFTTTGSLQSIDLTSANVFNGKTVALQSTGNASIGGDALALAASNVGGRLTAIATSGGISQTGALTVGADGNSFTTTGSVQSIDLTNANVFNGRTVALQSTGNASISGDALALAASNIAGRLTAVATSGGISQTGALTVGVDGSTFTTTGSLQSIDLTSANVFNGKTVALQSTGNASIGGDALALAASNVGGRLTAIATSGSISQTGALTVGADGSSFTTTGSLESIDLTSANVFNGKTVALQSTGNASIGGDALALAASNVGGRLTAIATSGGISQTGALTIGADGSSFTTTGSVQSIDLTSANVFNGKTVALQSTGNASINGDALALAASNVAGRLTAVATAGGISQAGALTVGADGSSFTTTGSVQSIDLTNANVFNGKTVALQSTGDASITADSLVLATSSVGGRLTATATAGGISQTGAFALGADGSRFTTDASNQAIALGNPANAFNGKTVGLQTTGANGNATLRGDALTLAASNVGGQLSVTSTGAVTQTGALVVGGATVLTAAGTAPVAITLDDAGNDFGGNVLLTTTGAGSAIGNAVIVAQNGLSAGGTAGSLQATAGGALTLSGGTFAQLGARAQSGIAQSAPLTVTGATTLTGAPGMSVDLASQGAGNLLQTVQLASSGAGNLGTVRIANAGALSVGGDATLLQVTAAGALTLVGGRYTTLALDTGAANGAVGQTGALQVGGTSTVAAGAGTVTFGNAGNDFGVVSITSAGSARLVDANDLSIGASQVAGRFELDAPGALHLTGPLTGTGSLALTGPGTLLIDSAHAYTGGTVVQAGTLALDGGTAQAGVSGPISVAAGARLDLRNGATIANPVTSLGGTLANSVGSGTLAGPLTLLGATATTVDVAQTAAGLALAGPIGDAGTGSGLTKTGGGALTLSAANGYTGATLINAGTLFAGGAGSGPTFAAASPIVVAAGATLALLQDQTLGTLAGAGNVALGGHDLTLGAGAAAGSVTVFSGAIGGQGGLAKVGAGTQVVAGADLFSGGTTVAAGTLQVAGGQALADNGAVSVAAGARLALADDETIGALSGAGTVDLGARRLTTGTGGGSGAFAGSLVGSGGLTKVDGGTLSLTGNNPFTGDVVVGAGSLVLGSTTALAAAPALSVAAGATVGLGADVRIGSLSGAGRVALQGQALDTGANGRDTAFVGTLDGAGSLTKSGSGTFTLGGSNLYTGSTTVAGGVLNLTAALPAATALGIAAGATVGLGTELVVGSLSGTGTLALGTHSATVGATNADSRFDGTIGGTGNLVKQGTGTLVLAGTNTYAGSTQVQAGTLAVGVAGGTGGTLGTGAVTNDATLRLQRSDATRIDNAIGGSGTLVVADGSVTLTNPGNGYTGATLVQGGALLTAGDDILPSATTVQVNVGARLVLGGRQTLAALAADGDVTVTGDVSTAGDQHYGGVLTVQSTAGVRFTAARLDAPGAQNQLGSQPISITAGTVQLAAAQALVLGDLQIGQGGQITAPKIDLVGNLALAQGVLGLTATAAPDPAAAVTDPTARVPGSRTPLAIAETTLTQGTASTVTVAAGAELDLAATGGGSVQFAQDANSFLGALSVLSGPAFNTAWSPNVQGSVAIQSQVRIAGGTVNVGGAGIEADTVSIRADQLSTTGAAKLTARLPFDDVSLGTVASLPSMLLDLSPTAFLTTASFGTSMVGIQVEIGSRLTGNRIDGPDAGYLTVRPKNGAQGMTAIFLSGPNSSATVGGYRFFQDGAGNQSEIPVFYNNLLPQTPQVSGALSSVAAVGEAARKERFEETVRTENVAVRLRSGVIAEVGPGRPATVGTEGARPPESCPPNRSDALTCN